MQPASVSFTITDVSPELFSILSGVPLIDLLPTPQNRDTWRRNTLQKADQ